MLVTYHSPTGREMKVGASLKILICDRSFTTSDTMPMGRPLE